MQNKAGSTRRMPLVLLLLAGGLLVARILTGIFEDQSEEVASTESHVKWVPIAQAEIVATTTKKPILYDFTAEWCGPCKAMDKDVYADKKTAAWINQNFVPVKVLDRLQEEGKNPPDIEALEDKFDIEAFPTLVIVSPRLKEPEVFHGYQGKDDLVNSLERVLAETR